MQISKEVFKDCCGSFRKTKRVSYCKFRMASFLGSRKESVAVEKVVLVIQKKMLKVFMDSDRDSDGHCCLTYVFEGT